MAITAATARKPREDRVIGWNIRILFITERNTARLPFHSIDQKLCMEPTKGHLNIRKAMDTLLTIYIISNMSLWSGVFLIQQQDLSFVRV